MPLLPYPPLRGTFPSRGRLCVGERHPRFPTHNKAALRRYFDSAAERLIYFNRGDSMVSGRK